MNIKSLAVLTGGILFAGSVIRSKFENKALAHEENLEDSLRKIQEKEQNEAIEENEKKWEREYKADFDKEIDK